MHAEIWINYDSVGGRTRGDLISFLGGRWDDLPERYATRHIEVDLDHVEICYKYCKPVP